MIFEMTGRHTSVKPGTREYIEKKLKKIDKVAHHIERVDVKINESKGAYSLDLSLHADRTEHRASAESPNVRTAIDEAIGKIERQLVERHKKRLARRNEPLSDATPEEAETVE